MSLRTHAHTALRNIQKVGSLNLVRDLMSGLLKTFCAYDYLSHRFVFTFNFQLADEGLVLGSEHLSYGGLYLTNQLEITTIVQVNHLKPK